MRVLRAVCVSGGACVCVCEGVVCVCVRVWCGVVCVCALSWMVHALCS